MCMRMCTLCNLKNSEHRHQGKDHTEILCTRRFKDETSRIIKSYMHLQYRGQGIKVTK